MDAISEKREKEKRTVRFMIEIYCRGKHKTKGNNLCPECSELAEYSISRIDHCPNMATKTFCSSCKTQCYRAQMKEKIRNVMKFSGPRMIIYCPKMVIRHHIEGRKAK